MNNKLRILIITPTYLPAYHVGGPVFQIKKFSNLLKKKKIDYKIITSTESLILSKKKEKNVLYFKSYFRNLYLSFSLILFFIKNIKSYNKVYIVSCFNFFSTISCFLCRIYKIDYFLSPRGSLMKGSINIKNKFLKIIWIFFFERQNINYAKKIIFSSNFEKKETNKVVEVKKFNIIQNFLQCSIAKNIKSKKNYLLYLGRIHPKKNIHKIIEAYPKKFDYKIKLIGPGNNDYILQLKKLISLKKLNNCISILKPVYNNSKNNIFAEAQYSILLSETENFGNTILESILNFTPVIISKKTGLSNIIKKYKAGYIINNSIKSLKNTFAKIQKKNIHKISKNTIKRIAVIFDENKIINNYLKAFNAR